MNGQQKFDISLMYIEDDQPTRAMIEAILQRRVRELFVATNGADGLALFREHHPDLVVTDIRMPVMDGLAMARMIREESREVLLIVTSAHSDTQFLLDAIDVDVDQYVLKPVNVEKLTGAVAKCAEVIISRRAEKLRQESETRFRAVFENSVDAIGISRVGSHVFVNPAYLVLFGYGSQEDLTGKPILDLIAPDERSVIMERVQRRARGETVPSAYETRGLRKNGEEFIMEVHASTYELSGEEYTLVILRDITERKRNVAALSKLSQVVEQSPASVVITDTAGTIEYVNPRFTELTGYSAAEAIGENPRILQSGKTSAAEYAGLWADLAVGKEWHGEFCNRKKNGELYWESATIAPVKNDAGVVTHFVAIKEDITEKVQLQEMSRKFAHDLEQLLAISHQITISSDLKSLYRTFVAAARDILALDYSTLMLLSEDKQRLTIMDTLGWPEAMIGTFSVGGGQGIASQVFLSRKVEFVEDFERETRFEVPAVVKQKGIRSAIAVPMLMQDEVIGVLVGHTLALRVFSEGDRTIYQHIGNQAAVAIRNVLNSEVIRKNAKYIRDVTAALGEGVYVLNAVGEVTFMNPEAEKLLGWSEEEFLGRNAHDLAHNQWADGTPLSFADCNMRKVIETGLNFHSNEEVFIRKDGTVFPVSVHSRPLLEEGKIVASVTAFRDISERKRIEQEREQLIADLQKALAEIKTLHGIIPICASCKKIRDEEGAWHQLESYISAHSTTKFSHGICKDCAHKLYPDLYPEGEAS
ncbi:MAG: PAS domain S-box protein [Desulfobulbaceae bacterium]|nr:PAS domain S-box protein [Desulfobulbaceae bacterium]